jgi:hypothetical protein
VCKSAAAAAAEMNMLLLVVVVVLLLLLLLLQLEDATNHGSSTGYVLHAELLILQSPASIAICFTTSAARRVNRKKFFRG